MRKDEKKDIEKPDTTKTGTKKLKKGSIFKIILSLALFSLVCYFIYVLTTISFLPPLYVGGLSAVILVVFNFTYFLIWRSKKSGRVFGFLRSVFIFILSASIVALSLDIRDIEKTLFKLVNPLPSTGTSNMIVLALKDDPIVEPKELFSGKTAIQSEKDQQNLEYAIKFIESEFHSSLDIQSYSDAVEATDALLNKDCRFLMVNNSYFEMLQSIATYEDLPEITKVVYKVEIDYEIDNDFVSDTKVTEEPFTILISGADSYEKLHNTYRSDVNQLITVNPKTKQILITSFPRDAYVSIPCWNNQKDKLTHAPAADWREPSGVNCLVKTVESFLDVKIDFYAKINFSSLIKIVDTAGGITIDNPYEFKYTLWPYDVFKEGMITLNGTQALEYVRERKTLKHGDMDRNLHQTIVIKALIEKILQPSMLTKADDLLGLISDVYQTNITETQIASFIRMQLGDFASWTIQSQALQGQMAHKLSALLTKYKVFDMCVIYPNQKKVAQENIKAIINGSTSTITEIPKGIKQDIKDDTPKKKVKKPKRNTGGDDGTI